MNKPLIITYDLCGEGKDYDSLIDAIKNYPLWFRITESFWLIFTSDSCISVRDNLASYMDSDDRLFVALLEGSSAWKNTRCTSSKLKAALDEYAQSKKNS